MKTVPLPSTQHPAAPIFVQMRTLVSLVILLFVTGFAFPQGGRKPISGLIIGNLLDSSTGKGLPDVTIQVISLADSANKKFFLSDNNGGFEIHDISFGLYKIQFTSIGYASLVIDSINVREERFDFNLGDIKLNNSSSSLQEVIIYSEKPLIENKDGKITFNVGESALSSGASTSELLKNMPLISNDANGKLLLKGKEPRILIDDKPTQLNAQQLADLLESMPGSSIEKIEIMTNPPPQFANESGGVINIVTKKGRVGFTGRLNASYGTRGEGTLAANVSYRKKEFTLTVTAGTGANRLTGAGNSFRSNFYTDSTNYFQTSYTNRNKTLRPNLRIAVDYEFNKQNQINFTTQFNANFFDNSSLTEYKNLNRFEDIFRWSTRSNNTEGRNINPSASFTYTHKGKDPREVLRFIATYSSSKNEYERLFFQQFLNPDKTPANDSTQKQNTDNKNYNWDLRLNYDHPVSKKVLLTAGITSGRNTYHNSLITQFQKKPENLFVYDPLFSKDFWFFQSIHTARGSFVIDFSKKWRITSGIQVENTQFRFSFETSTNNITNSYWNWLPHFTLRKEWTGGWNSSVVYRKSIRRPGINELNPSIDYNDPYNLRFGNPLLLPQLADNFDWNTGFYKGKSYVNVSIGYNYVRDIIQSIRTLVPGDKTQITFFNITDRREYEFSIWGGYTFSKKLRMNSSAGYTYNVYSVYDRTINKYRNGGTFYTSINYNYIFNDRVSIEGNVRYNAIADPQGRSRSNITQNFGLQTKWKKKQLIISINFIDFLSQQQFTTYTYGSNFELKSESSSRTRNLRIGVSYNLKSNAKRRVVSSK